MRLDDFLRSIEAFAHFDWAEDWDNSGLLVRSSDEVSKVGVTLDLDERSLSLAAKAGCDCILTHHPLIFSPLRSIDISRPIDRVIKELLSSGVSLISCHTNWDNSPVGTNKALSMNLGLIDLTPLIPLPAKGWGVGALGTLHSPVSSIDFSRFVKRCWNVDFARFFGDKNRKISKVALCGGSGGDLWRSAHEKGADIYITADIKYHQVMESLSEGLMILQVDHGEMEWVSMAELAFQTSNASGVNVVLLDEPAPMGVII